MKCSTPPPPPTACTQTSAKVTDVTETIRSSLCAALVCGTIHHGPGPHPPTLSMKGLHTLFCVFPFLCLRPSLCLVHPASPAPECAVPACLFHRRGAVCVRLQFIFLGTTRDGRLFKPVFPNTAAVPEWPANHFSGHGVQLPCRNLRYAAPRACTEVLNKGARIRHLSGRCYRTHAGDTTVPWCKDVLECHAWSVQSYA